MAELGTRSMYRKNGCRKLSCLQLRAPVLYPTGTAGPRKLWRPRDPLEGRGEQANVSDAGNMTILRGREHVNGTHSTSRIGP